MNWISRVIFGEEGQRSMVADLRSGRAGWPIRLGLSLAAAAVIMATCMLVLGLIDHAGHVQEEHIATAFALGGAGWCVALVWLWAAHRKWARVLRTIFALIAIWVVTIPLCVLITRVTRAEEFFIGAFIVMAIGLSIGLVAVSIYRGLGGKAMVERTGEVRVKCPDCGYSMVGLESCTCPECGRGFTIDQLIAAQDYAALREEAGGQAQEHTTPVHLDPQFGVPSTEY